MENDIEVPSVEFRVHGWIGDVAHSRGWGITRDQKTLDRIVKWFTGLARHGLIVTCPCATDGRRCPCEGAETSIEKHGACKCGLFVKKPEGDDNGESQGFDKERERLGE